MRREGTMRSNDWDRHSLAHAKYTKLSHRQQSLFKGDWSNKEGKVCNPWTSDVASSSTVHETHRNRKAD